ncbi:MAG: hybrid sensor histidine kinase/response regulator [Polyangiales bacterium]
MTEDKPLILLVDDRRENLQALEAALEGTDARLVRAQSGLEALGLLLEHPDCALILLDVAMPELDGFETAKLIRGRPMTRQVPIIFVTASSADANQIFRGYEEGAVDYLVKPLDVHALRAKAKVFTDLWSRAREVERAHAALREADRRERHLLETLYDVTFEDAPIGIGHATIDGRWLRINRRLGVILGRSADEVRGTKIEEVVHSEDKHDLAEFVHDLSEGRVARHRGEYRLVRPDGGVVWVAFTFSLVRDLDGKAVQLAIVEDITEEKRLAIALEASERRFARLRDSGLLGVYQENSQGVIVDANDAFLAVVGYSREDLLSGRVRRSALMSDESAEADAQAHEELLRSGVCRPYERTIVRKDGRARRILAGAVANGSIIGFALDVTALRDAEQVRARGLLEWEKSLRVRDDFIAIAAHELRNPLTPLVLQASSLRSALASGKADACDREWLDKQLEIMQRSTARLARLVDDLLVVSRATVGQIELTPEETDLDSIVRGVVERAQGDAAKTGSALSLRVDGPVRGLWDRLGVERVVANLLSNALKHGAGGPVEVTVDAEGNDATIAVRDHGPGVPPEERTSIFERYERRAPLQHAGGFGVGLWIARQIVEAHRGRIDVWSALGEGTRFTVRLPRTVAATPIQA